MAVFLPGRRGSRLWGPGEASGWGGPGKRGRGFRSILGPSASSRPCSAPILAIPGGKGARGVLRPATTASPLAFLVLGGCLPKKPRN